MTAAQKAPLAPVGSGRTPDTIERYQWASDVRLVYYSRQESVITRNPGQGRVILNAAEACRPSQYAVHVTVAEFAHAQEPGQPVSSKERIRANGFPTSQLQVALTYSTGAGIDPRYVLDVGAGFVWKFWGTAPKVFALIPEGGFIVANEAALQPAPGVGDGLLLETLLDVSVQRAPDLPGESTYQHTFSVLVLEDQVGLIPIPYGTQYVEVFQDAGGEPSTPLEFVTDTADICPLIFQPGLRRTGVVRCPGHARFIRTSATMTQDRRLTAIFELGN